MLTEAADVIAADYPSITVEPVVADFNEPFAALPGKPGERLVIFLGGTIGNFDDEERAAFLARIRAALDPGDHFLLGADLVKPRRGSSPRTTTARVSPLSSTAT